MACSALGVFLFAVLSVSFAGELETRTHTAAQQVAKAASALAELKGYVASAYINLQKSVLEAEENASKWTSSAEHEPNPGMRAVHLQFADGARTHRTNLVQIMRVCADIGHLGEEMELDLQFAELIQTTLRGFAQKQPSAPEISHAREGVTLLVQRMDLRTKALTYVTDSLVAKIDAAEERYKSFAHLVQDLGNPQDPIRRWEKAVAQSTVDSIAVERAMLRQLASFGAKLVDILLDEQNVVKNQRAAIVALH